MVASIVEDVDQAEDRRDELTAGPPRAARAVVRRVIPIVALAAVFFGVLVVRTWNADSKNKFAKPAANGQLAIPTSAAIEQTYGVRFTGVDVTSAGGMIQVRYQILDKAKTEAIHDDDSAPYVIDADGKKYADPGMVGHSHVDKNQVVGATDYILLANAAGGVRAGSVVTIKIGDLELRNVPVD
jgi:hypothetical protein